MQKGWFSRHYLYFESQPWLRAFSMLLELGIWSPQSELQRCPRGGRKGGKEHRGWGAPEGRLQRLPPGSALPTPAPLRSRHWKNFPDLLTSQPSHWPTAAWIPMQHLTPVLLAGMMVGGRLWVTVFLFPHLCWQLCLFPVFLRGERRQSDILV